MLSLEIQKKIRQLHIVTRRLVSASLIGNSSSAQKGFGFDFDQIRDYRVGDDIRFIDWKSSSKLGTILVKQYIEERNRRIIVAIDISGSSFYGSSVLTRAEVQAQLAVVLTLVASYGNDSVGVILFSDDVELFIPPSRGPAHVQTIVEKIFAFKPVSKKTNIARVLDYLSRLRGGKGMLFVISDFIDHGFEKSLRLASRRYDLVAIRCIDARESELENVGFLMACDPETGLQRMLDTRGKGRFSYLRERLLKQENSFKRQGVHVLDIQVGSPFIAPLVMFFRRRMMY